MKTKQILLVSAIICVFTIMITILLDLYVFPNLSGLINKWSQKYLIFNFNIFDYNLIRYFPLIAMLTLLRKQNITVKYLIKINAIVLISILLSISIGFVVAINTWTNASAISPLLPTYIKYQPFSMYWTLFILLGISLPLIFTRKSQ